MSVTARRSTMGQNVCWPEKTEPRERTRKAMSDEVGEVGLGKGVGGCVGNGKRDWMARSSGGVEEEEYEALGRDDVWGEDALASSRLE